MTETLFHVSARMLPTRTCVPRMFMTLLPWWPLHLITLSRQFVTRSKHTVFTSRKAPPWRVAALASVGTVKAAVDHVLVAIIKFNSSNILTSLLHNHQCIWILTLVYHLQRCYLDGLQHDRSHDASPPLSPILVVMPLDRRQLRLLTSCHIALVHLFEGLHITNKTSTVRLTVKPCRPHWKCSSPRHQSTFSRVESSVCDQRTACLVSISKEVDHVINVL